MRNNKIFILGGRSGTSLMLRLLARTLHLRGWKKNNIREPGITRDKIRKTYPNIPMSIFDDYQENFQIIKLPHFDFIIDLIIKKYNNPIFIVMDRKVSDIISSYKGTRFSKLEWAKTEMSLSKGIKSDMIKIADKQLDDDLEAYEVWLRLSRRLREKYLKNYDKNNIFYIDFDEFMSNFEVVMRELSKFLDIRPMMSKWNRLRRKKWSPSAKGINYYIK